MTVQHAQRLVDMIKEAEQAGVQVLCGGSAKCDAASKYVHPTVLLNPPRTLRVMTEEVFGPILSVHAVRDEQAAIDFVNSMPGTPLALYVFTTDDAVAKRVLDACPSGGAIHNDCLLHYGNPNIPFGGLGTSGYGFGHGKFDFFTFTHARGVMSKPCRASTEFGGIRYMPFDKYGGMSGKALVFLIETLPDVPVLRSSRLVKMLSLSVATGLAFAYGPPAVRSALVQPLLVAASSLEWVATTLRSWA